ncbi:TonB-dependent receptor [Microbulbifer hainanensis]|uniref:TonB-dependent receptor n=1 Tax=Microbulbifer hainanensis TaxID=2735675 RepID=UPI0018687291|nr:TonB-dependent receptor [Microbulbifer hainanensis]
MRRNLLSLAIATSVVVAPQTFAQTLEEVTVTAQKRAQSAQDVAISIAAMGSDDLEKLGVMEASQLTEFVPNMELSTSPDSGIPIFVIRGVGLQDYNANNTPTTAVVVDDVYQPFGVYGAFAMFDTERVEILKGPQGGLYGRNSTGGAINIVSRRPEFDKNQANAAVDVGNYGTFNVRAGADLSIADNLAARVALQNELSEGWFENTYLDRKQGGRDKTQARITLSYEPTDNLHLDLRQTFGRDKSEVGIPEPEGYWKPNSSPWSQPYYIGDGRGNALPDFTGPIPGDYCDAIINTGIPDASCVNINGKAPDGIYRGEDATVRHFDDTFNSTSFNVEWDLDAVTLVSVTNFTTLDFFHVNGSGSVGTGAANQDEWEAYAELVGRDINFDDNYITNYSSDINSLSQELRLLSNSDGPFNWMAGASYAQDQLDENRTCTFSANLYADWVAFPGCGTMEYEQETKVSSVYGQLVYDFNEAFTLTTDLRYTREQKDYVGGVVLNAGAWACNAWGIDDYQACLAEYEDKPFVLSSGTPATYDEKDPSWKVTLDWKPTEDTLLYTSVGHTFKSGGFFGGFFFNAEAVESYKPETNTAVELGFKSTLAEDTMQLNGAIFHYDYKGFQSPLEIQNGNATFSGLTNMGDVETRGAELDLRWLPIMGLDLRVGVGYMDTEIVKGPSGTGRIYDLFGREVDVVGNELNNAPGLSVSSLARYEFGVTDELGAALQLGVNWTDDYYLSITNEPYAKEDGGTLVNARAELFQEAGDWTVSLWGRNLTDRHYRTSTNDDGILNNYSSWSAPRTFGATLSYNF